MHRRRKVDEKSCVCVFFPFIPDIKFVGRTSRGHTGFLIHLLSAVRALIFLARRIQPLLSLVDREVDFCVLTISSLSTRCAFVFLFFCFLFFSEKNPVCRDRTHVLTCQRVTRGTSELPGRPVSSTRDNLDANNKYNIISFLMHVVFARDMY